MLPISNKTKLPQNMFLDSLPKPKRARLNFDEKQLTLNESQEDLAFTILNEIKASPTLLSNEEQLCNLRERFSKISPSRTSHYKLLLRILDNPTTEVFNQR